MPNKYTKIGTGNAFRNEGSEGNNGGALHTNNENEPILPVL